MKNLLKTLAFALIVTIGFSANAQNTSNKINKQKKVEEEVLQASKNWIRSFNSGNTIKVANGYTENAIMVAKPFGTFNGRVAIGEFWTKFIQSGATNLIYTDTKVKVINNKKAIVTSNWSMNVGKGIITNETWVKINGIWELEKDNFEVKEQFKSKN
jgi:ketosteroid isomerase-like protein